MDSYRQADGVDTKQLGAHPVPVSGVVSVSGVVFLPLLVYQFALCSVPYTGVLPEAAADPGAEWCGHSHQQEIPAETICHNRGT